MLEKVDGGRDPGTVWRQSRPGDVAARWPPQDMSTFLGPDLGRQSGEPCFVEQEAQYDHL